MADLDRHMLIPGSGEYHAAHCPVTLTEFIELTQKYDETIMLDLNDWMDRYVRFRKRYGQEMEQVHGT